MKTQKLWKVTRDTNGQVKKELFEVNDGFDYLNKVKTKSLWYELYEPNFNLLFTTHLGSFDLMDLPHKKLGIVLDYYAYGKDKFTISGAEYKAPDLRTLKIFTYDKVTDLEKFQRYCNQQGIMGRGFANYYFTDECLSMLGTDVTEDFLGDNPYGYKQKEENKTVLIDQVFVNKARISELKEIKSENFDLTRLIKLCEEMNINYAHQNYLSVGMIGRTIVDHVPPIFNCKNFDEVTNNIPGKSFKENMQQLNGYLKNIANTYLHQQIRKKETLPNYTQVEFRSALDVLLEKISEKLHQ